LLETVRNYTEEWGASACEGLVQALRDVAAVSSHSADDDHTVDLPQERERIRDSGQWWGVDHDDNTSSCWAILGRRRSPSNNSTREPIRAVGAGSSAEMAPLGKAPDPRPWEDPQLTRRVSRFDALVG